MKKSICSLFQPSQVNTVLNNLSEAGFSDRSISVKASKPEDAAVYASDTGPYKGLTVTATLQALEKKGLPTDVFTTYQQGIEKGMMIVVVTTSSDSADAAKEILSSAGGVVVTEL